MSVLHTWGSALTHPYVHMIVPGGGLSPDGSTWIACRPNYLLAAKAATESIPIVFNMGGDPVQIGLVASLNRPGGNVTGVSNISVEITPKRLGLLHELVPAAGPFVALVNPNERDPESIIADVRMAAATIGRPIDILKASSNREIDHESISFRNALKADARSKETWIGLG
jgi:ABC transporter substrate binding protein/Putative transposase